MRGKNHYSCVSTTLATTFAALLVFCFAADAQSPVGSLESAELVRRVLARPAQLISGRIEYEVIMSFRSRQKNDEYRYLFSFAGPSWIVRCLPPNGNGAVLSHGDKYIQYTETRQNDGSLRRVASLQLPKALDHNPRPPSFAGTIWEDSTKKFIADRSKFGIRKSDQEVKGRRCQVWEWSVNKVDVPQAFYAVSEVIKNGGVLRLYVATEMGYVLPRIEQVGNDGAIGKSFESTDFREAATGIYLPKTCRQENRDRTGMMSATEYRLVKIEKVNEPLGDEEFIIRLPVGTEVFDDRTNRPLGYTITDELPFSVTGLTNVELVRQEPFFQRNRVWAIALGATLGLTLSGGFWWWWRRKNSVNATGTRS